MVSKIGRFTVREYMEENLGVLRDVFDLPRKFPVPQLLLGYKFQKEWPSTLLAHLDVEEVCYPVSITKFGNIPVLILKTEVKNRRSTVEHHRMMMLLFFVQRKDISEWSSDCEWLGQATLWDYDADWYDQINSDMIIPYEAEGINNEANIRALLKGERVSLSIKNNYGFENINIYDDVVLATD